MTYPKAPPYHVWNQFDTNLWKCRYCTGWFASKKMPDQEAHAMSEEKAREQAAESAPPETKQ